MRSKLEPMRNDIGKKIRQIRLLRGYSQEYMAESLTVSQKAYSKYERGQTQITLNLLEKIANKLEVCHIKLLQFDQDVMMEKDLSSKPSKPQPPESLLEKLLFLYEQRIAQLETENARLKEK